MNWDFVQSMRLRKVRIIAITKVNTTLTRLSFLAMARKLLFLGRAETAAASFATDVNWKESDSANRPRFFKFWNVNMC